MSVLIALIILSLDLYGRTAIKVRPIMVLNAFSVFSTPVASTVSPAETKLDESITAKALLPQASFIIAFINACASFGVNVLAISILLMFPYVIT